LVLCIISVLLTYSVMLVLYSPIKSQFAVMIIFQIDANEPIYSITIQSWGFSFDCLKSLFYCL